MTRVTRTARGAIKVCSLFAGVALIVYGSIMIADAADSCINTSDEITAASASAAPKKICHYSCPNGTKPSQTLNLNQSCPKTIAQGAGSGGR